MDSYCGEIIKIEMTKHFYSIQNILTTERFKIFS